MNKIVKVTNCNRKLQFVKAIINNTSKSLYESKCIADSLIMPDRDYYSNGGMKSVGTLLLNESSITPEQWEAIVEQCNTDGTELEWSYVEK